MVTILQGDAIEQLRTLPDCSVHMCVTSPPYFGLRDYGVDGQIGLEATPEAYVARLVEVFREVRRVLRDDGTLWLNLGDSYTNKQLTGIPWRVAFALQADGWWLRQDIIWHKPNPMPESVTDRCTKAHEYVFLLSKSSRYYYDHDAVKEPSKEPNKFNGSRGRQTKKTGANGNRNDGGRGAIKGDETRNRRSVWTVTTRPYKGAHFATFPPKLIEPCILAGTSERGVCPHCGAPWQRLVDRVSATSGQRVGYTAGTGTRNDGERAGHFIDHSSITVGWSPTCNCPEHEPISATVLDPFGGSGTTAVVAQQHGRHAILIELNPAYIALAEERIGKVLV